MTTEDLKAGEKQESSVKPGMLSDCMSCSDVRFVLMLVNFF